MVYDGGVEHAARASGEGLTTRQVGDMASDGIGVFASKTPNSATLLRRRRRAIFGFSWGFLHLSRRCVRSADGVMPKHGSSDECLNLAC